MCCSARFCLPLKLALIIEGSRSKNGLEQTSMAAALGDMFPADLGPLIDMSGKVYAHTVSLVSCLKWPALCLSSRPVPDVIRIGGAVSSKLALCVSSRQTSKPATRFQMASSAIGHFMASLLALLLEACRQTTCCAGRHDALF